MNRLCGDVFRFVEGSTRYFVTLTFQQDYRESCKFTWRTKIQGSNQDCKASFTLISSNRLPVDASRVSLNQNRPPLILIPVRSKILLVNACHLSPRRRPSLIDDRDLVKLRPTKRVRVAEDIIDDTQTEIEGWSLSVAIGEDLEDEVILACVMSSDRRQVAAVGAREGMWLWQVQ